MINHRFCFCIQIDQNRLAYFFIFLISMPWYFFICILMTAVSISFNWHIFIRDQQFHLLISTYRCLGAKRDLTPVHKQWGFGGSLCRKPRVYLAKFKSSTFIIRLPGIVLRFSFWHGKWIQVPIIYRCEALAFFTFLATHLHIKRQMHQIHVRRNPRCEHGLTGWCKINLTWVHDNCVIYLFQNAINMCQT